MNKNTHLSSTLNKKTEKKQKKHTYISLETHRCTYNAV